MGTFKGLIMLPFTLVIYILAVFVFNLIHAIPTLDYAFAALRFTRRLGVSGAARERGGRSGARGGRSGACGRLCAPSRLLRPHARTLPARPQPNLKVLLGVWLPFAYLLLAALTCETRRREEALGGRRCATARASPWAPFPPRRRSPPRAPPAPPPSQSR